jgi:hypothetical protein
VPVVLARGRVLVRDLGHAGARVGRVGGEGDDTADVLARADMVTRGSLLSTRVLATWPTSALPATSVTKTRRSYRPSARPAVSRVEAYGELTSMPIVVHVSSSAGERWKLTELTPVPPASLAVAESETVPRRFAPGSSTSQSARCGRR